MLADLNVPWPTVPNRVSLKSLSQSLFVLRDLGYTHVALNFSIDATSRTKPVKGANSTDSVNQIDLTLLPTAPPQGLKILTRATLILDDASASHELQRITTLGTVYDLVAVRPKSEKTLQSACTTIDGIDIISIEMTTKFPSFLKHKTVGAAVGRGIKFEICYSGGHDPSLAFLASDKIKLTAPTATFTNSVIGPEARRNIISNAKQIVRSTRKRGIIISSESYTCVGFRGPFDVINLASTLYDLDNTRARHGLDRIPGLVITSGKLRKSSYKQVILTHPE